MKIRGFGKTADGRSASLCVLRNSAGAEAHVTNYGATLVRLIVPDRNGRMTDVVLGHDDVNGYESGEGYLGATVGRFANRIGGACFTLNGKTYELTANDGPNTLHSGRDFYSKRMWDVKMPFIKLKSGDITASAGKTESLGDWWRDSHTGGLDSDIASGLVSMSGDSVIFCLDSPDGDQGFPGDLHVEVTYTLTENNELHIDYYAALAGDSLSTPLSLTNHSYFNLNGQGSGDVYSQTVMIDADCFTPNDKWSLPTGELRAVEGTPMDFRVPKRIGQEIKADDEQIEIGCGYDHNFVLRRQPADDEIADGMCTYRKAATLYSGSSGILMTVLTDLPGMQLYTGNHLGDDSGKEGAEYRPGSGVCFETQFWPDAVNREDFPGGVLNAGREFHSRTTYAFSCK